MLTIAIPTYNRASYLSECLESILPQMQEGMEILVSDNASTDNTEEVVKSYLAYPFITYYKNKKNIGMDGNFFNCLRKAKGDYVHLISDDDIMCEGALQKIQTCIEEHVPDLIFLNSYSFMGDYRRFFKKKRNLSMPNDITTTDKSLVLDTVGIWMTYMPGMVLKRQHFLRLKKPSRFIGTYFSLTHVAFLSTKGEKKISIIKDACVANRGGNAGGYNLYKVWIEEYKRLLLITGYRAGYDRKQLKKLFVKTVNNEIRHFIMTFRRTNTRFDLKNRRCLVRHTFMYPSVWFRTYPVAFFPVSFLEWLD